MLASKTISFLVFLMIFSFISSGQSFMKLSALQAVPVAQATQPVTPAQPTQTVKAADQAFCFLNNNGTVYDINPLYNSQSDYNITQPTYTLEFNVCKNALAECPNNRTGLVIYRSSVPGIAQECIALSGPANVVSKWSIINDSLLNKTSLQVDLPHGDTCKADNKQNYTTTMVIECEWNAVTPVIETTLININSCSNTIKMRSKSACPRFDIYSFWMAIQNNKYIFGSIVVLAGIFFCFFGIKFIYITEVLTGIILTAFLIVYLLFSYMQVQYSTLEFWLIIAVAVLAGLIVGYFIAKNKKIPVLILGAFLGYIVGVFLYQFFLKFIKSNPEVVFWITIISCITIFAIISWFFYEHILILGTAFIGAYAIIRGISFIAGHFPDERQLIDLISKGEWAQVDKMIDWRVYLYLASWVILGIFGAYIQYKNFYESDEEKEKKEQGKNSKDEAHEGLINK